MITIFENRKKADFFFSVCIETSNRGNTIFRALESIAAQSFTNFECIIVDNCSTDNSVKEILRFVQSSIYEQHPFSILVLKNEHEIPELENWNSPLKYATAKYIAILEGDDTFSNIHHLENANKILIENINIGVYATGSQRGKRPWHGLKTAKDYFIYNYNIINVSPPSETIFIRKNKSSQHYFFDAKSNVYAPELQLWLQIAADGFDAYHTNTQDIYREAGSGSTSYQWKFFQDKFYILNKFKTHNWITNKIFDDAFNHQFIQLIRRYIIGKHNQKTNIDELIINFKKLDNSTSLKFSIIILLAKIIVQLPFYTMYKKVIKK